MQIFARSVSAWALTALLSASPALAGTFEVKTPDVAKGETEVGINAAFFTGYPINADLLRTSIEVGAGYGLTDWWKAGLKVNFDRPVGEDIRAVTAGVESLLVVRKLERGFGFGLYGGLDFALRNDETNTATFGPILQFGTDKTSLSVNPLLATTFGPNRQSGIDLVYGWQAKHELREGLSIGIEGYGIIPHLGSSPGPAFQEHRIGPVIYFERALGGGKPAAGMKDVKGADAGKDGGGPKFAAEIGLLRGLTEGTQDWALKVKGGITF